MGLWKIGLGYVAGAWFYDVMVRPARAAKDARRYCHRVGKPLLNVGSGTEGSSFRAFLFGPTRYGDVNLDLAAPANNPCPTPLGALPLGPRACHGDALALNYPDKYFGAVIASHVLEHLEDPESALVEWQRVADRVYVIVPRWWGLHTWAQTEHRWYIDSSLRAYPLWKNRRSPRSLAFRR